MKCIPRPDFFRASISSVQPTSVNYLQCSSADIRFGRGASKASCSLTRSSSRPKLCGGCSPPAYICPDSKIYLSKLQNVFVQIDKCICQNYNRYLSQIARLLALSRASCSLRPKLCGGCSSPLACEQHPKLGLGRKRYFWEVCQDNSNNYCFFFSHSWYEVQGFETKNLNRSIYD